MLLICYLCEMFKYIIILKEKENKDIMISAMELILQLIRYL